MSKEIDINENNLGVFSFFAEGYHREYSIREISTLLPISHGTAQTIPDRLGKNSHSPASSSSLRKINTTPAFYRLPFSGRQGAFPLPAPPTNPENDPAPKQV
jgi:hypothetical protein